MYFYILDPHNVPQRDFERQQTELQSLLTEHKIGGEIAKVTPLRIIADLVDIASSHGVKTLVACGTDDTFNQMLAQVKDRDFTFGFIPLIEGTQLGKILGMKDVATSVKTIASRRIEKMDVAKINKDFFISYLELGAGIHTNKELGMMATLTAFGQSPIEVSMRIDDAYTIHSKISAGLIINTRGTTTSSEGIIANPQDGFLDLLLIEKLSKLTILKLRKQLLNGFYEKIPNSTVIRCKKIELLEPYNTRISIDGKEMAHIPSIIELFPSSLKMIVGRDRTF